MSNFFLETLRKFVEPAAAKNEASAALLHFWTADGDGKKLDIPWTLRDALPGVFIFGRSGSGKTSGPGRTIADALLSSGMGGLVLCGKTEEADEWEGWAQAAGRGGDVVRVTPEGPNTLNVLEHENEQPGANTESLAELLLLMAEAAGGSDRKNDEWQDFTRTFLRNGIDLLRLAGEPIRTKHLLALASDPKAWETFYKASRARTLSDSQSDDLEICVDYFGRLWPGMAAETRSSIESHLVSLLDPLSRGVLRDLFGTETTLTPEATFDGKIIVVDLPTKKFHKLGRLANVTWKLAWQRAVERRGKAGAERPAFLWADEFQQFATSRDADFALTARSAGGLMVLLTQSIAGLWQAYGGPERGRAPTETLLGNLPTKIFCQNDDRETNRFAKELIGRKIQIRRSQNSGFNSSHGGGGVSGGSGSSEQMDFILEDNFFTTLANGGTENNKVVTALLYTGRRLPPEGEMFTTVAFKQ